MNDENRVNDQSHANDGRYPAVRSHVRHVPFDRYPSWPGTGSSLVGGPG